MTSLLHRLRLRTKLAIVLGLAVLALIASIDAGASLLYRRMVDDRVGKLSAVLETTISLAKGLEAQVTAKQMTHEQALERMRAFVHQIRFGEGDYISIQAMDGIVL